jgi:glycosyltransferase involved in cell wall biosynthesis
MPVLDGKTIAVVVPCYNEQTQIGAVLTTMPDFVDCVIVVDDASPDATSEIVRQHIEGEKPAGKTKLIRLEQNAGVGAAIVAGYKEAIHLRMEVVAVMAGDGQMDAKQLRMIAHPVARGDADYAKANRLYFRRAWGVIPHHRYLGNAFLSMLTKIASGYWHVADSQTGFTAIALEALETIDLDGVYKRYGYPNDMLVRLNVYDFRVMDVPVRPIYNVGEKSKMQVWKVIPRASWLIFKRFLWRLWVKYVIHDFHPLVLFYLMGMLLTLVSGGLFVRMMIHWIGDGRIPAMNALAWAFCTVSAMQLSLFAMWFDMEMNRDASVRTPPRSRTGAGG